MKKRITSELLHLALVITLLRGDVRRFSLDENVISSNFFNDVYDTDSIQGPNWAYTRASYHRLIVDPGLEDTKLLNSYYNPDQNIFESNWDEEFDEVATDQLYRQQARLLLLSRLNNPHHVRKDAPTTSFQDITAYLVSDTTAGIHVNSLAEIIDVNTHTAPSVGSSGNSTPLRFSETPPPSVDSGHGDYCSGSSSRSSNSESEEEPECLNSSAVIQDLETHVERNENEEMEIHPNLEEDKSEFNILGADLNTNMEMPDPEEFLNFIRINHEDENNQLLGATALPPQEPHTSDYFVPMSNHASSVSELFDLGGFELDGGIGVEDGMEWAVVEEQARLNFYKSFNDITEAELMQSAPMKVVEGESPDEESRNGEGKTKPVSESSEASEADLGFSSETRIGSSSDNAEGSGDECEEMKQTMDSLIDELWETDSGVFDFLESPSGAVQNTDFNYDQIPSVDSTISSQLDEDSASRQEADDSNSPVDMIQAAPIHSNARPTSHPAQPRGFQVHARMPGLLRGGSMDQRWQELASLLSLQQPPHDGSGGPLPPSFTHPFGPHHHHHLHHAPAPLHHHPMHHPPFSSAGPPTAPYNTDAARSVLIQNATLAPSDLNSNSPYGMGPPPNVGSAVASSMHLTNSSDPMIDPSAHYKMIEPSHDMIYYPNTSSGEMGNQTTEGFLSSILNDDDLQLMDMAMNEGMHTLRQLDSGVSGSYAASIGAAAAIAHGPQPNLPHGAPSTCPPIGAAQVVSTAEDRLEASSDSAVSSMGSERVPPMTDPAAVSDSEWVDPDSHPHSSHDSSPYSLDYTSGKLRGYDYYGKERVPVPVAQKKHHMFGKRFQQEQSGHPYMLPHHPSSGLHLPYPTGSNGIHHPSSMDSLDMKYSCGVDFARHQNDGRPPPNLGPVDIVNNNHTYALPNSHPENPLLASSVRPSRQLPKEKPKKESLSRDEKRARSMSLPITTEDIINLPMDEFNERLSKYDLSEAQLTLIRDIRRRGKNKVAAQNCRKRKLDQILQLADEVQRIRDVKQNLLREREELVGRRENLKEKYALLYRHVFQSLRDPDGNPYSLYDYTLQQAADGNIVLVPRNGTLPANASNGSDSSMNPSNPSRRDKSKDEYKKDGTS